MSKRHLPLSRLNLANPAAGPIRALTVALVAGVCATAHAEYRCTSPSSPEAQRACELARQNSSDALRHYIQRTGSIYGLYFYDYVRPADFERWDAARRDDAAPSVAALDGRRDRAEKVALAR
jgi:hypothetical protein